MEGGNQACKVKEQLNVDAHFVGIGRSMDVRGLSRISGVCLVEFHGVGNLIFIYTATN